LRMQYLPGERLEVQITGAGQNRDQGVGYLDDGTMVVVDGGKSLVGQKVRAEVVRSLQTEAGRMMFANIVKNQQSQHQNQNNQSNQNRQQNLNQQRNNKKYQRKTYRPNRRRRTPEDSLIAAANGREN